jgi:hypothetical protein
VDRDVIIRGDDGLPSRQKLPAINVATMVSTFPYEGNFQSMVANFRKEAQAQPGQVKNWMKGAHQLLNQLPQTVLVRTPQGVMRAKRDMDTMQPYHHGYLQLAMQLDNWNPSETEESYLQASAMIAALRPLVRSWRKSGGNKTSSKQQ